MCAKKMLFAHLKAPVSLVMGAIIEVSFNLPQKIEAQGSSHFCNISLVSEIRIFEPTISISDYNKAIKLELPSLLSEDFRTRQPRAGWF